MKNNSIATTTKQDKFQNNIGYFFIGIWICALIGFHKTYTVFFPSFKGFYWQHHFHGAMMMIWLVMLIVQPFLIKYGKYKTHRTLGKLGYVFAPLVLYSSFALVKMLYYRDIATMPENIVFAKMQQVIPTLLFGLFFTLAMINRHKPNVHARYMIGTALLTISPGLSRALIILGGIPFPIAIHISYSVVDILALLLLFHDFRKGVNIKPALTIVLFFVIKHVCSVYQNGIWWQKIAKWFVTVFF
jgi:hypothetical protein